MKSYKITESEKPLVEINHETPIPVGKQVLVGLMLRSGNIKDLLDGYIGICLASVQVIVQFVQPIRAFVRRSISESASSDESCGI